MSRIFSFIGFLMRRSEDDFALSRERVREIYERDGVTPELRRVYGAYLENKLRQPNSVREPS